MNNRSGPWTRRHFSHALAASTAASFIPWRALAATPRESPGIAFVGSTNASPSGTGPAIHVFQVSSSGWRAVQVLAASAPVHLELHPTLPVLYAIHAVGLWDNLPRGAVSAYDIASATGRLTLRNTQPLSLSATYPRHAAVAAHGRHLLVAAESGVYNLLPLSIDGSLKPPIAIRKECGLLDGAVQKPARPQHVAFHPNGAMVLTADSGLESIASFALRPNTIRLQHRMRIHAGAGPSQIALTPSGHWIYAMHAANGSIAVHGLNEAQITSAIQIQRAAQTSPGLMAMHPGGRFLVAAGAGAITAFSLDAAAGHLAPASTVPLQETLNSLAFTPAGTSLLATRAVSGHVVQISFDAASGVLGSPQVAAQVDAASTVVFLSS